MAQHRPLLQGGKPQYLGLGEGDARACDVDWQPSFLSSGSPLAVLRVLTVCHAWDVPTDFWSFDEIVREQSHTPATNVLTALRMGKTYSKHFQPHANDTQQQLCLRR